MLRPAQSWLPPGPGLGSNLPIAALSRKASRRQRAFLASGEARIQVCPGLRPVNSLSRRQHLQAFARVCRYQQLSSLYKIGGAAQAAGKSAIRTSLPSRIPGKRLTEVNSFKLPTSAFCSTVRRSNAGQVWACPSGAQRMPKDVARPATTGSAQVPRLRRWPQSVQVRLREGMVGTTRISL